MLSPETFSFEPFYSTFAPLPPISHHMEGPPKPWPTGQVQQLEPLVQRVLATNPSPYTYTGTQTYLVGAGPDIAVVDPGPKDARHIESLLAAIGERKLSAIMCTHTHKDHSPAAAPLAEATGAAIIGCAPLVIESDEPRADAPFDKSYAPDRVLEDGEAMTGTGWTLRAVHTPGHTSNHLCFSLEESGALFTGDHVMAWSTSVVMPPDGDMADYMASLTKLYDREDTVFYPAHGEAITKPRQLVRGMVGHRRQRERQILRHIEAEPKSIKAMVPDMYKGIDKRLYPAAGQSVLAHLIDLERRGEVAREGEMWQIASN